MEHTQRYIFLALALAWTLFRLFRYLRVAGTRRPGPAIPPSSGVLQQTAALERTADVPAAPATVQSPIESAGSRLPGTLAMVGIFIVGNAVIWPLLFATPGLGEVPTLPRLVAGVLANFALIRLASGVAARLGRGPELRTDDDRNPIK